MNKFGSFEKGKILIHEKSSKQSNFKEKFIKIPEVFSEIKVKYWFLASVFPKRVQLETIFFKKAKRLKYFSLGK